MNPEELYIVSITEEGIGCEHPEKGKEFLKWSEIEEVEVRTTDEGPFLPDVWYVFKDSHSSCTIPQGAKGFDSDTAFSIFGKFTDFNYENFISSMSSSENKIFLCWKKKL